MRRFTTDERLSKITGSVYKRQYDLRVVMENIHDPHNVSAIFRTCDAVGVPSVSLIYTKEKFPKIGKTSSASAFKWVEKEKFKTHEECFKQLKNKGYQVVSSMLDTKAKNLYDLDLTKPTAIVVGNENRGISEEVIKYSDECFYIPMQGMIQSLNVSVATAVVLYEALRQRFIKGMYDTSIKTKDELENIIDGWCER